MSDFQDNVLNYNKPDIWKLDDGLDVVLIKINKNKFIQTLYSKKANFNNSEFRHESYIEICYFSKVELKIFREIIPQMQFKFCNIDVSFNYSFDYPKANSNTYDESKKFGLGCVDDQKYFNINNLRLCIETDNRKIHDDFWHTIEEAFSTLIP